MVAVRYAVAGSPVTHSLSPLLYALVNHHLMTDGTNKSINLDSDSLIDVKKMSIIEASQIEDALAWVFVDKLPGPELVWIPMDIQLGKWIAKEKLRRVASEISSSIIEPHHSLESSVEGLKLPTYEKNAPGHWDETWISLTSPLKHQLSSAVVFHVDGSEGIDCINSLRWNTREWWVASTDGPGVVHIAQHHGIDFSQEPILNLSGGGSASRSSAWAWSKKGGKIKFLGGKRTLGEGPWNDYIVEDVSEAIFSVDFSSLPNEPSNVSGKGLRLQASYAMMEGDYNVRISNLNKEGLLDGRWLLTSQHLVAWATLWNPAQRERLPSLGLLLSRLVAAEELLSRK